MALPGREAFAPSLAFVRKIYNSKSLAKISRAVKEKIPMSWLAMNFDTKEKSVMLFKIH